MSHRCQVDVTVVSLCHYLNNFQFILILIRPVLGRENRRILGVIYLSISNGDHHLRPRDGFLYFFTFYTCDFTYTGRANDCLYRGMYCMFRCGLIVNHTIDNLDQKLILRFDRIGS